MAKWKIPGGSVAVVKDGRLVLAHGYGRADRESREPVAPGSLFRIASAVSSPGRGPRSIRSSGRARSGMLDSGMWQAEQAVRRWPAWDLFQVIE